MVRIVAWSVFITIEFVSGFVAQDKVVEIKKFA